MSFEDNYIPEPNSGCWLWTGPINRIIPPYGGYGRFNKEAAHRYSFRKFKGEIPTGKLVLHKCDVRGCVNPDHLFLGTHQENTDDMFSKGRDKCENVGTFVNGSFHRMAKLTESTVKEIKNSDLSHGCAARLYNVHKSTIKDIRKGRTWRHVI